MATEKQTKSLHDVKENGNSMIDTYSKMFNVYCLLLNAALESKNINKKLFLSRGGLRLRRLYGKCHPNADKQSLDFYTSRLATIKASTYIAPEITTIDMAKEYYGMSLDSMLKCFLGAEYYQKFTETKKLNELDELESTLVQQSKLLDLFGFNGEPFLRDFVKGQYELLCQYWRESVEIDDEIALIDTGWSGTIVFYLKLMFPNYNINAFFFGKTTYGGPSYDYHMFVHGVMFDTNKVIPGHGFSYLIENRHLIEMICEPQCASTESYIFDGLKVHPNCGVIPEEVIIGSQDDIYNKILLKMKPEQGSLALNYFRDLRRATLYPSKKDVEFLSGSSRSADFGKEIQVQILLKSSSNPISKIKNIRSSLWRNGQVVREFGRLGRLYLYLNYQVFPYVPWLRRFTK